MNRNITLAVLIALCVSSGVNAETYYSDDFEITPTSWTGVTDSLSLIDSETGYGYSTIWPTQTTARHAEVAEAYGYSGKGLRFSMDSSGAATQESCIFGSGSGWSATTLWWGFWHRMDQVISQSVPLKMTRFYSGGNSVIPEWYGSQWNFFYNGGNHFVSTGAFQLTDTNWHKYVMQFVRGNNANDGVIRMYVDDSLVYEDTAVNWNDTGTTFTYSLFPMVQGNMSGSYSGGAMNTYYDNIIFASTEAEVLSFLGGSEPPASEPANTGSCYGSMQ